MKEVAREATQAVREQTALQEASEASRTPQSGTSDKAGRSAAQGDGVKGRKGKAPATSVRLPVTRQGQAECLVHAVGHVLALRLPADKLPTWGEEFMFVTNELDRTDKAMEVSGDDTPEAYRAVPHSDVAGNFLAQVGVTVVDEFHPMLKLVPATVDELEGWDKVPAQVRHWGSRESGHFVAERENPKGSLEIANSLQGETVPITESLFNSRLKRKWRLWQRSPASVAAMPEGDLRALAARINQAARQLVKWGRHWTVTPEAVEMGAGTGEIGRVRKWVLADLASICGFD
eukprot:gene5538-180_t